MENCKSLNCDDDEDCYLSDEVNVETGTSVSKLVCAKVNPCYRNRCPGQKCVPVQSGDLASFADCRPCRHQWACWRKDCGGGNRCFGQASVCKGETVTTVMKEEGVCFPREDCDNCNYGQRCEVRKTDSGYSGFCVKIKQQ